MIDNKKKKKNNKKKYYLEKFNIKIDKIKIKKWIKFAKMSTR